MTGEPDSGSSSPTNDYADYAKLELVYNDSIDRYYANSFLAIGTLYDIRIAFGQSGLPESPDEPLPAKSYERVIFVSYPLARELCQRLTQIIAHWEQQMESGYQGGER